MSQLEAIRVHVIPKSSNQDRSLAPRETFWNELLESNQFGSSTVNKLERRLISEFPRELSDLANYEVMEGFDRFERSIMRHYDSPRSKGLRFYERFAFRSLDRRFQNLLHRIQSASRIKFVIKLRGYQSLDFDILPAPISEVAEAFEKNIDLFRAFLDIYIPRAFAQTYTDDFADGMIFDITVPQSYEDAFYQTEVKKQDIQPIATVPAIPGAAANHLMPSHRKIDSNRWLWLIANGTLLIPVALSIWIISIGWKELAEIRQREDEFIRPVLAHQLELLKEDRQRLQILPVNQGTPSNPKATPVTISQPPPISMP